MPQQQPPSGQPASAQTQLPPTAPGSADLDPLQKAVAQTTQVEQSAVALINGIAQHIKDLGASAGPGGNVPASEVNDLAKQLTDSANALAAAVKANTPTTMAQSSSQPQGGGQSKTR